MNDDELAAVIAALSAVMEPQAASAPAPMPAWRRAMRLESTGNSDVL
jgi:hypothetical protein